MKQKIDYRNAEDCLHATYKDMKSMTLDDAVFILSEYVRKYHEAKSDKGRTNLPRARMIKAYELLINKAKQPDMREKVKEYISELDVEIERCHKLAEQNMYDEATTVAEMMVVRVQVLTEVKNDLQGRLDELI